MNKTKKIDEIKKRIAATTKGKWVYDNNRHTHDSCIYVEGSEDLFGYIGPGRGCVVGSSEWIWIEDNDGEFIANAKDDIEWLIGEVERLSR